MMILKEELKGLWYARKYPLFLGLELLSKCLGNPYRICSRWLKKQGATDIYVYGETPLTTFAIIADKVQLHGRSFIDLGSGRGRVAFWAALVLKCQTKGVEQVPGLVRRASLLAKPFKNLSFSCAKINALDLGGVDVAYLASTCMEEEEYEPALLTMKKGATLISVSAPVMNGFIVKEVLELPFHFGTTSVYIQIRSDVATMHEAADQRSH